MRALVVGDVLRRFTGRVLAQTYATQLQQACPPFQFGLSTRAGTEALARVLKVATELDPRATVPSVDAAGAYDHVSNGAMEALHARPRLQPLGDHRAACATQVSLHLGPCPWGAPSPVFARKQARVWGGM